MRKGTELGWITFIKMCYLTLCSCKHAFCWTARPGSSLCPPRTQMWRWIVAPLPSRHEIWQSKNLTNLEAVSKFETQLKSWHLLTNVDHQVEDQTGGKFTKHSDCPHPNETVTGFAGSHLQRLVYSEQHGCLAWISNWKTSGVVWNENVIFVRNTTFEKAFSKSLFDWESIFYERPNAGLRRAKDVTLQWNGFGCSVGFGELRWEHKNCEKNIENYHTRDKNNSLHTENVQHRRTMLVSLHLQWFQHHHVDICWAHSKTAIMLMN